MISWVAIFLAVCLALGYVVVFPLKEKVPYLVMADAFTGTSTVSKLNNFGDNSITKSEAINKSNVSHFVTSRESYDWELIGLRDWNTVFAMSSAGVATEYKSQFDETNPSSPDKVWGAKQAVRIKIKSISLIEGADKVPAGATVRFDRILVSKEGGAATLLDSKLASLAFEYKDNLQMDEKFRIENPLGFQVSSYRVDNDYDGVQSSANSVSAINSVNKTVENSRAPIAPTVDSTNTKGVAKP